MKVREVIAENKKIDEVAPLVLPVVGAVTLSGILAGVSAILTAMDIVNIYKLITKAGNDPKNMSDDDWVELFISVLFMLPMLKYIPGKSKIASLIPDSWKRKGGEKVKEIVTKKEPGKMDKVKTVAKVGAGATAAGLAGDAVVNKEKSIIGKAISGSGSNSSTSTTPGGDSGSGSGGISNDDPLYKYARWFGRAT